MDANINVRELSNVVSYIILNETRLIQRGPRMFLCSTLNRLKSGVFRASDIYCQDLLILDLKTEMH